MKECLFNTYSNNIAAYCRLHSCSLTVKQLKCKNCLGKQCWHFVKNEEHPYWLQREVVKQRRKNRKQMINAYVSAYKCENC